MIKKLFFFSIAIQLSTAAFAYNLYKTPNGSLVRWDTAEVEIVLDPGLSALGTMDLVEASIEKALSLWQMEADVPVQFNVVQGDCHELSNDGNNCVFACTDPSLCPGDEKDKGAGAFLSVSPETGAIQDADIMLNAVDWKWAGNGSTEHTLNLTTVMTHEIGHALGIDHSSETEAVMYEKISTDEDKQPKLYSDDILAAQSLYEDFVPQTEAAYGCAVVASGHTSELSFKFGIFALLAVVFICRARKETR